MKSGSYDNIPTDAPLRGRPKKAYDDDLQDGEFPAPVSDNVFNFLEDCAGYDGAERGETWDCDVPRSSGYCMTKNFESSMERRRPFEADDSIVNSILNDGKRETACYASEGSPEKKLKYEADGMAYSRSSSQSDLASRPGLPSFSNSSEDEKSKSAPVYRMPLCFGNDSAVKSAERYTINFGKGFYAEDYENEKYAEKADASAMDGPCYVPRGGRMEEVGNRNKNMGGAEYAGMPSRNVENDLFSDSWQKRMGMAAQGGRAAYGGDGNYRADGYKEFMGEPRISQMKNEGQGDRQYAARGMGVYQNDGGNPSGLMQPPYQKYATQNTQKYMESINHLYRQPIDYNAMGLFYGSRKKRRNNSGAWHTSSLNQECGVPVPPSKYSSLEFVQGVDTRKTFSNGAQQRLPERNKNNYMLPMIMESEKSLNDEHLSILNSFKTEAGQLDLENITVFQLKALMKEYGLNHAGKKNELIENIKETLKKVGGINLAKIEVRKEEPVEKEMEYDKFFF